MGEQEQQEIYRGGRGPIGWILQADGVQGTIQVGVKAIGTPQYGIVRVAGLGLMLNAWQLLDYRPGVRRALPGTYTATALARGCLVHYSSGQS